MPKIPGYSLNTLCDEITKILRNKLGGHGIKIQGGDPIVLEKDGQKGYVMISWLYPTMGVGGYTGVYADYNGKKVMVKKNFENLDYASKVLAKKIYEKIVPLFLENTKRVGKQIQGEQFLRTLLEEFKKKYGWDYEFGPGPMGGYRVVFHGSGQKYYSHIMAVTFFFTMDGSQKAIEIHSVEMMGDKEGSRAIDEEMALMKKFMCFLESKRIVVRRNPGGEKMNSKNPQNMVYVPPTTYRHPKTGKLVHRKGYWRRLPSHVKKGLARRPPGGTAPKGIEEEIENVIREREGIAMNPSGEDEEENLIIEVVGKVLHVPDDLYVVDVKDKSTHGKYIDETYIVRDVERFKRNIWGAHRQKVVRVIFYRKDGAVIFTAGHEFVVFGIKDRIKKYLIEKFGEEDDEFLKTAVGIVAGSDSKEELRTFLHVTKVHEFFEISKEMEEPGIQMGLGFPGSAFGLIFAERETFFGGTERVVIIQEIRSYMEGYTVTHRIIDKTTLNVMKNYGEKIEKFMENQRRVTNPRYSGKYYRLQLVPPKYFKKNTFRTHDVGRKGHTKRIAGMLKKKYGGKWVTQAWLLHVDDYDFKDGKLIPRNKKAKEFYEKLVKLHGEPIWVEGRRFILRPAHMQYYTRKNIPPALKAVIEGVPKSVKPTPAQKRAHRMAKEALKMAAELRSKGMSRKKALKEAWKMVRRGKRSNPKKAKTPKLKPKAWYYSDVEGKKKIRMVVVLEPGGKISGKDIQQYMREVVRQNGWKYTQQESGSKSWMGVIDISGINPSEAERLLRKSLKSYLTRKGYNFRKGFRSNPRKKTPKCPKCDVSLKYVGMGRYQHGKKKYKVYQCPKCKKYFKE